MASYLRFGLTLLAILAGILFNRQDSSLDARFTALGNKVDKRVDLLAGQRHSDMMMNPDRGAANLNLIVGFFVLMQLANQRYRIQQSKKFLIRRHPCSRLFFVGEHCGSR